MKKSRIFIDGSSGTTGLKIRERLSAREDIELLYLPEEKRKDVSSRKEIINSSDITFLCLPDDAAKEAACLVENENVAVIDTSSAHRTDESFVYGFPEMKGQRDLIASSKRISNPGCHASGFISAVMPLVSGGLIGKDEILRSFSLTGYSGGGKKMISEYEDIKRDPVHESGRIYALSLSHKHLPEMKKICSLSNDPVFVPVVGDYFSGMATEIFLPDLSPAAVFECLSDYYRNEKMINVRLAEDGEVIYSSCLSGYDNLVINVSGKDDMCLACAIFDNLGKGASGAAIQNMNILLGVDETLGLNIKEV